jgi:hypothetical protein
MAPVPKGSEPFSRALQNPAAAFDMRSVFSDLVLFYQILTTV